MQTERSRLTRRGFLGAAAGAALVAGGLHRPAAASFGGGWLDEPRRLYSHRGFLPVLLAIEEREVFVAGAKRKAIVYNGSFPGPTLVADPGDQIFVRLVNRLATRRTCTPTASTCRPAATPTT